MKWAQRRNSVYGALALSLILATVLNLNSIAVTVLTAPNLNCVFRAATFRLKWRHSVEKEYWIEQYRRSGSRFILTATQFKTFGAGTPDNGALLPNKTNSGWISYQLQLNLAEINRNVTKLAELELILDSDHRLPLALWLPDYSLVELTAKKISPLTYLKSTTCYE